MDLAKIALCIQEEKQTTLIAEKTIVDSTKRSFPMELVKIAQQAIEWIERDKEDIVSKHHVPLNKFEILNLECVNTVTLIQDLKEIYVSPIIAPEIMEHNTDLAGVMELVRNAQITRELSEKMHSLLL